jgi:hypothetical protein
MRSKSKLPFLPGPILDETFGSWLWRCAAQYHTSPGRFANSVMETVGGTPLGWDVDWDVAPPRRLLAALAKLSNFKVSELKYLIVPSISTTLPRAFRDAYCPKCFGDDLAGGVIYFRKVWLDAWTIVCPLHGCLLGRFSGRDYRPSHAITSHFPGRLSVKTDHGQLIAEEPAVCEVFVDSINPSAPNADDGVSSEKDTWLDRNMLKTIVGRDLLMIAGSEETYFLFQQLFGYARTRSFGCEDNLGNSSRWPKLRHPEACINVRVRAFFLANLLWNCIRSTDTRPRYYDRIVTTVGNSFMATDESNKVSRITDRWPAGERERWIHMFGRR